MRVCTGRLFVLLMHFQFILSGRPQQSLGNNNLCCIEVVADIYKAYTSRLMTKTNKTIYEPSEDSDQPGHPLFAIRMKKAWVLSYPLSAQQRLWSDWADLSLLWVHMPFRWFCHEAAQLLVLCDLGDGLLKQVRGYSCCWWRSLTDEGQQAIMILFTGSR